MGVATIPTEQEVSEAFHGDVAEGIPELRGKKPVRRLTANVVEILRSNNNFFITGDVGLAAAGLTNPLALSRYLAPEGGKKFKPDEVVQQHNHKPGKKGEKVSNCPACEGWKLNPDFDASAPLVMVPGIVEVIMLISCDRERLRLYLTKAGREALASDVFDFMEQCSPGEVLECMEAINVEVKKLQDSSTKTVDKGSPDKLGEA